MRTAASVCEKMQTVVMYGYIDLQKLKKIIQICRVNSILDENVNSKSFIFT